MALGGLHKIYGQSHICIISAILLTCVSILLHAAGQQTSYLLLYKTQLRIPVRYPQSAMDLEKGRNQEIDHWLTREKLEGRSGMGRSSQLVDKSIIDLVMLRFRPIAPRPANGLAVSSHMVPEKTNCRNERVNRKYARTRRNKQYYCKRKRSSPVEPLREQQAKLGSSPSDKNLVTLQLLPKLSDDYKDDLKKEKIWCNIEDRRNPFLMQWNDNLDNPTIDSVVIQTTFMTETWVIVERVTNTSCTDGVGLGFSDMDLINNLGLDLCPGFVSDISGKVQWVNEAYKKLVSQENEEKVETMELGVRLVMKEELPCSYPSFACTVRFEYPWGSGSKCSRIVPCDVWRMDFGGFAWKLDMRASLSLGLQPYTEH